MKNLVIFHMESVSNVIFKFNNEYFPNLQKWSRHFENYVNYYSTATSTLMVMSDLFFGDMSIFEESDYLEDIYTISPPKKSVFEYLNDFGYLTQAFYYGYIDKKRNRRLNNVLNKNGTMWEGDDEGEFFETFTDFTKSKMPFAVFIEENVSHVEYEGQRLNKEGKSECICRRNKYHKMDETIGKILEYLKDSRLLDNTVVILYGDHGDEYWFHGFHEGYTHAIEPYSSLVHCPLFVYNGLNMSKTNEHLISTIDIYDIIINELGIEKRKIGSEYAISRNLFARQKRRAGVFNKGYSITDGNYTLLLTRKGLSMYENKIDPYNFNNVLDLFLLKKGKLQYNRKFDHMLSDHYKNIMTQAEQNEIENQFKRLNKKLYEYIDENKYLRKKYNLNKIYRGSRYKEFFYKRAWKSAKLNLENRYYTIKRIIEKRRKNGRIQ